jgi:excisionase family DNA binding protein
MRFDATDVAQLKPLIAEIVAETVTRVEQRAANLGDRLGYTEPEAAAALGVPVATLREARRRGELAAKRAGKHLVYSRTELMRWLSAQ